MLVQKLRLQRGWSQQQLAELGGLSVRTIQRIESGQPASTETLKSLASVFEIEFSQLSSEPDMNTSNEIPTLPANTREREEQLAFKHVRKVKGFYIHLLQYVIIIGGLALINLLATPHTLWAIFPALGWGIGLLAHAATTFEFLPFFGPDWEKRQVEKRLGRPL